MFDIRLENARIQNLQRKLDRALFEKHEAESKLAALQAGAKDSTEAPSNGTSASHQTLSPNNPHLPNLTTVSAASPSPSPPTSTPRSFTATHDFHLLHLKRQMKYVAEKFWTRHLSDKAQLRGESGDGVTFHKHTDDKLQDEYWELVAVIEDLEGLRLEGRLDCWVRMGDEED